MATHSSILAWRIPWTEKSGEYSPLGHKGLGMTEQLTLSVLHISTQENFLIVLQITTFTQFTFWSKTTLPISHVLFTFRTHSLLSHPQEVISFILFNTEIFSFLNSHKPHLYHLLWRWRGPSGLRWVWRNGRGPHLERRQEPQASCPFRTPTAGSLQSWDRRVRPRLV